MTCAGCAHWHRERDESDPHDWRSKRPGTCHRYPQAVETPPDYHCGEHTTSWLGSELRSLDERWNAADDARDQRKRAIAAEKALKATRAELRELKRKLAQ